MNEQTNNLLSKVQEAKKQLEDSSSDVIDLSLLRAVRDELQKVLRIVLERSKRLAVLSHDIGLLFIDLTGAANQPEELATQVSSNTTHRHLLDRLSSLFPSDSNVDLENIGVDFTDEKEDDYGSKSDVEAEVIDNDIEGFNLVGERLEVGHDHFRDSDEGLSRTSSETNPPSVGGKKTAQAKRNEEIRFAISMIATRTNQSVQCGQGDGCLYPTGKYMYIGAKCAHCERWIHSDCASLLVKRSGKHVCLVCWYKKHRKQSLPTTFPKHRRWLGKLKTVNNRNTLTSDKQGLPLNLLAFDPEDSSTWANAPKNAQMFEELERVTQTTVHPDEAGKSKRAIAMPPWASKSLKKMKRADGKEQSIAAASFVEAPSLLNFVAIDQPFENIPGLPPMDLPFTLIETDIDEKGKDVHDRIQKDLCKKHKCVRLIPNQADTTTYIDSIHWISEGRRMSGHWPHQPTIISPVETLTKKGKLEVKSLFEIMANWIVKKGPSSSDDVLSMLSRCSTNWQQTKVKLSNETVKLNSELIEELVVQQCALDPTELEKKKAAITPSVPD